MPRIRMKTPPSMRTDEGRSERWIKRRGGSDPRCRRHELARLLELDRADTSYADVVMATPLTNDPVFNRRFIERYIHIQACCRSCQIGDI